MKTGSTVTGRLGPISGTAVAYCTHGVHTVYLYTRCQNLSSPGLVFETLAVVSKLQSLEKLVLFMVFMLLISLRCNIRVPAKMYPVSLKNQERFETARNYPRKLGFFILEEE